MTPAGQVPALRALARLHGILPGYLDGDGKRQAASADGLRAVLRALGTPLDERGGVREALRARRSELRGRVLEPVVVVWRDGSREVPLRAPPGAESVTAALRFEDGAVREWRARLQPRGPATAGSGRAFLPIPEALPSGYHELRLRTDSGVEARTLLLSAPLRSYRRDDGETARRRWGAFLPLHAVRSSHGWGIGDFGDLGDLGEWVGGLGGGAVGTLPLLATFLDRPFEPSPYAPVTRLFWNEAFLRVGSLPGAVGCAELRRYVEAADTKARLERLEGATLVDWREVAALKRSAIEAAAECALADGDPAGLTAFEAAHAAAAEYARFRAVTDAYGPWPGWPPALRSRVLRPSDAPAAGERYHRFAQWAAHAQLSAAAARCASAGGGLYLDLPLGVHPQGYDAWRERELFVEGASVGAPPDPFFAGGQDWGFPPVHPERMREDGYRYLRACLGAHMEVAAYLRLDHVMALHRLYWVPPGCSARDGVYVRYPAEELYAVLSLESHRHRCELVGEDLGTVPRAVRAGMDRHGIRRMYVVQFEVDPGAERPLRPVPEGAQASVNTHDMPPFAGFWCGADIHDRVALGWLDADEAAAESLTRRRIRAVLAGQTGGTEAAAFREPLDGKTVGAQAAPVRRGLHRGLAGSPAGLVLVTLEDLWLETRPQNVPGTGGERPNWRRRAALSLEEIRASPAVTGELEELERIQRSGSEMMDSGNSDDRAVSDSGADRGARDVGQGDVERSAAAEAAARKRATPEAAAEKPPASKPPAKKRGGKKGAGKKSPAKKASARKPASRKAVARKPGAEPRVTKRSAARAPTEPAAAPSEPVRTAGESSVPAAAKPTAPTPPAEAPSRPTTSAPGRRGAGLVRYDTSRLTADDLHLFNEGTHYKLYEKLGAHPMEHDEEAGTYFAVWAPNAHTVSVVGDFNGWEPGRHPLRAREASGIWEGFLPGVGEGALYKYHIASHVRGYTVQKADPFGYRHEEPPRTASVVTSLDHDWRDDAWLARRGERIALDAPISIYEVHIGSWGRVPEEGGRPLTYRELAPRLAEHVRATGFTHVEFLPVMEHPFYGSWGYQTTGYFAPTSRYGSPADFMALVDHLHRSGIGVILDWVPSHFPTDEHGLGYFDGTHLFEHEDPRRGFHPDWSSAIFNYGRNEVRSFLMSSALFWLDRYHADGLRVDAVASMLYLDYSRNPGEWIPNEFGGRENLEAIDFLRRLNEAVYESFPDVQTIAEESTAWPMVSRPTYVGGLGFGLKWDMGWMHDTLRYMAHDPVHRAWHHNELTFRAIYAFNENFVLPLSHDEVVHGKGSLLGRMPGDDWQKMANLRLLLGCMFGQPGKKLLFMGAELGQWREWSHDSSLDWHLLEYEPHRGLRRWVVELNRVYREEPALHEGDNTSGGFEWLDANDAANSVITFLRKATHGDDLILVACNFTPIPRRNYRVGVPRGGTWRELLNSDAEEFGGSGHGNLGGVEAAPVPCHGRMSSLNLTLPPLAMIALKSEGRRT